MTDHFEQGKLFPQPEGELAVLTRLACAELSAELERPDITLQECLDIRNMAGELQTLCAERKLRAQREAGKLLMEMNHGNRT